MWIQWMSIVVRITVKRINYSEYYSIAYLKVTKRFNLKVFTMRKKL